MAGVNKVILLGNLGRDPEIRYLDNNRAKASFTMATSETYKNASGERITQTEWHNIVLWGPITEVAEKYLKKGSQVYIEGKLTHRSYTDKEGNPKYITEVVGREMTMLGNRRETDQATTMSTSAEETTEPEVATEKEENELPF